MAGMLPRSGEEIRVWARAETSFLQGPVNFRWQNWIVGCAGAKRRLGLDLFGIDAGGVVIEVARDGRQRWWSRVNNRRVIAEWSLALVEGHDSVAVVGADRRRRRDGSSIESGCLVLGCPDQCDGVLTRFMEDLGLGPRN